MPKAMFDDHPMPFEKLAVNQYRGFCSHVYDGDTINVVTDLGFYVYHDLSLRFSNFSAPEVRGAEKSKGMRYKRAVEELINDKPILFRATKGRTFTRWLGVVAYWDGVGFSPLVPAIKERVSSYG